MNTQMMLWIASTGVVACMASVIIALLAGMRYSAHLRRMPAATALENVVERLMVGREELKRVEADSQRQREEHNTLRADLDGMIVRRKEEETRLHDLQQDVANLDHYRAEIVKVRDELTEGRTQLAEILRDLTERRAEYNELILAAERAKAQITLLDERKAEIEALGTAEHEMRTRLTEARGEFDYINRQLAVARVENDRLTVEREKRIAEIQSLEEKLTEIKNDLAKFVQERDPLAEELEKSRQELNMVSQEIKTARKQLQDFEEELANLHAARGATEVAVETARAELVKTQNDLEPARQEYLLAVTQLRSVSNQLNDTKDQLQEKSKTLIQLQDATETASAKLQAVQLDLEKVRQEYDPLVSEADNLRREIAGNQEKRQELEEILAGLYAARAINEAATAKAREDLEAVQTELTQHQPLKDELESLRRKIAEARDRQQDLDDEYARKSARLKEIDERKAEIEALVTAEHEMRTRLTEARGEFDYINRQLAVARVETERFTAEQEKSLTEIKNLEEKKIQLQNELAQIRQDRDPLVTELDKTRQELATASQELATTRKQQQEFEEELVHWRFVRANAEAAANIARTELESLQAEWTELQKMSEPLAAEIESTRREITSNRERRQELEEVLAGLYAARAITEAATAKAREDLEAVQTELTQHQPLKDELESLRRKIAEARDRQQELDADYDLKLSRFKEIEKAIQAQGGGGDETESDNALADLVRPPACLEQKKPQRPVSEKDALQKVREHLKALSLHFPERTLYAFHTALKIAPISPLTVLAGISGTGKSLLPRRYAEAMGIHFLKIPVQPRWDSPQDMLGFYNYLEKRYKATELARTLIHFDQYNWPVQAKIFKDRLLIVLLDEMNLARVEYYFSEFLSQLEGRPAPDQPDMDGIRKSEIMLDIGGASGKSCRIYPGHDMLFVGTMNEDESTQTLSDKVLDRANLLRFTRPNQLVNEAFQGTGTPTDAYLPAPRWHGWRRQFGELPDHLRNKITTLVDRLNNQLDELHRPFAHRVNQAMLAYIANYPGVAEPERRDGWESARMAFADQLEQRILPKLRGVDLGDARISQPLRQIGDLIKDELHDETLFAAFQRAAQDDGSGRPFSWIGVRREDAS